MKRMSAMVLSTICIMNVLSSPNVVSLADGNVYEYVDLSADSELRDTVNRDVVSDSNIVSNSNIGVDLMSESGVLTNDGFDASDDEFDESGSFEKYRTYLNSEKTMFRYGNSGRTVYIDPDTPRFKGLYYYNPNRHGWDDRYLPYTHEMEVAEARAVYDKQNVESLLNGLERFTHYYNAPYVLTDVIKVHHPYSFENYKRGDMFFYGLSLSDEGKEDVREYIIKKFPMVDSDKIEFDFVLRLNEFRDLGSDGTFVQVKLTIHDSSYDVLVPIDAISNDLLFIDGSLEKMTIKADSVVSDDNLNTITTYLKTSRNLSEIEVTNALVQYDDVIKLYYIEADYKFSESSDVIHGRIYFMGEGSFGFMHNKELLVEYSDDKTELTDDDVIGVNDEFKDVKENILSGFDIGVLDKHVEVDNNMLKVRIGHNAPQLLNSSCRAYRSIRLSDNDSYIWEYSVYASYKYDTTLDSIVAFDELKDKDLCLSKDVLYTTASADTQPLSDFVKAQIGGYEITSVKYIGESSWGESDPLIVYSYEVDGVKKYYVIRVDDSFLKGLRFRDEVKVALEPTVAPEELRIKVLNILKEKLGDRITDVQVSEVIRNGSIEFVVLDATGVKYPGYVNFDGAISGESEAACPPLVGRQLSLLWYDSEPWYVSKHKPMRLRSHYDDDGYTFNKNEEPEPSKPDKPVSPSEIEKPSKPDVLKDEDPKPLNPDKPVSPSDIEKPVPNKPVIPVSPSEIEKPVNPSVTPDKPFVPITPKPSVPDSVKPVTKATPSNIVPSHDRPVRNDSIRPIPSKPSVPQENNSVTITKVTESEAPSKDRNVVDIDRFNGNVQGGFRNAPLQSDGKPVIIENHNSRNVRTGDTSLAIVFGALAMINAVGLGFYFWKTNKKLED